MYSFAFVDDAGKWQTSAKEFRDINQASTAAGDWLEVCFTNGYDVAVRIVDLSVEQLPDDKARSVPKPAVKFRGREV